MSMSPYERICSFHNNNFNHRLYKLKLGNIDIPRYALSRAQINLFNSSERWRVVV